MSHSLLVFIFGILGNVSSFVVFLAPVPTFYRIIKKKSTEGFQSIPYVVALFSATMWLYYAYLKGGEMLLITINSFGCVIETVYIALYIAYAAKQSKVFTLKLLFFLNFGGFCILLALCHFLPKGPIRVKVLGGICVAFSVSVFAAPLSIIRVVIRTKSVEFMPFPLSVFLTITAVTWLLYGLCLKDFYVALPNVLGFIFGVVQMVLYQYYKNCRKNNKEKLPEQKADINIVDAEKFETSQVQIVCTEIITDNNKDDQNGTVEQSNKLTAEQQKNIEEIIITTTSTEDHKGIENFIQAAQPATVKCEA